MPVLLRPDTELCLPNLGPGGDTHACGGGGGPNSGEGTDTLQLVSFYATEA
jgi:hypothetical protein